MPANLTPEYLENEKRYRQAKTLEEKLDALRDMLRTIPKHKGTEKLQAEIKRKIKETIEELEKQKRRVGGRGGGYSYYIPREGAGQIALTGSPNSGKSSLLANYTGAKPEVGDFPFTTRTPTPGMLPFEDIQIQLLDLPPITRDYMEPWIANIIRYADLLAIMFDVTDDNIIDHWEALVERLEKKKIKLGDLNVNSSPSEEIVTKKTVIIANKMDLPNAKEYLKIVKEIIKDSLPLVPISVKTGEGIEELKKLFFKGLNIIRVYTKEPGKKPDFSAPYILERGATVYELAEKIHKELAKNLKFARVWGSGKHEGQKVNKDYVLEDKDVVEIHD